MVSKATIFEYLQRSHSIYRAMLGSEDVKDRANAEVYRLATQEFQEVALAMNHEGFTPANHLERLRARWNVYANTGKAHDNIDALQAAGLKAVVDEDRRLRGIEEKVPELPRGGHRKGGKGIEVINADDPRNFLDPKIIEGVLNEFRAAFGMPVVDYK